MSGRASNNAQSSSFYASPSQFLQNSFLPYTARTESSAPLFFSTLDGQGHQGRERVDDVEDDGDVDGYEDPARPFDKDYYAAHSAGTHHTAEDDHGGLGTTSAYASDDEDSNNPFDVHPHPSRSRRSSGGGVARSPHSPAAASSRGPYSLTTASSVPARARHWTALPSIQQSVINEIYDQAASVYTSVFIGAHTDSTPSQGGPSGVTTEKGKGREVAQDPGDEVESAQRPGRRSTSASPVEAVHPESDSDHDEPAPELLLHQLPQQRVPQRHQGTSRERDVSLPANDSHSVLQHGGAPFGRRMHQYPMPTIRYRRIAVAGAAPHQRTDDKDSHPVSSILLSNYESDLTYQDQSHRDALWLALYLFNAAISFIMFFYLHFIDSPHWLATTPADAILFTPAVELLQSIPLLASLSLATLIISGSIWGYLFLMRKSVRTLINILILLPPVALLLASAWLFTSSYSILSSTTPNDEVAEISGATIWIEAFMRWSSLGVLIGTMLYIRYSLLPTTISRRVRIERTVKILELACDFLLLHWHIFVIASAALTAFLAMTVPFLLTASKLFIHGYSLTQSDDHSTYLFLVPSPWSIVLLVHLALVFFWTANICRGIVKCTVSGSLAEWWFNTGIRGRILVDVAAQSAASPSVTSTLAQSMMRKHIQRRNHVPDKKAYTTVLDSFHRSVGPSLGTICAASLLLAVHSVLAILLYVTEGALRRANRRLRSSSPAALYLGILRLTITWLVIPAFTLLGHLLSFFSGFTLTYHSITGDTFWTSVGEVKDLIENRNGTDAIAGREL